MDWFRLASMLSVVWLREFAESFSLPALAVLALIMLWRKQHREFPLMFSYIVVNAFVGITGLAVARVASQLTYFYFYWIADAAVGIFEFLVIYELFVHRLFTHFHKIRFYRIVFAIAGLLIVCLTVFAATHASKTAALLIASRTFDFSRALVLCFFIALMLFMGREWTPREFGIALGFGIFSAAAVFTSAVWAKAHYGPIAVRQMYLIAYDISCVVWLIYFLRPAKQALDISSGAVSSELVQGARRTEEDVKDWLTTRKPSDR